MRMPAALLILTLVNPSATQAQNAPVVTLQTALSTAHAPDHGIILSIGADRVKLPPSGTAPPNAAGAADIGRAFDANVIPFGVVTAIAPAKMVVLKTPPDDANIYDGMPPDDAFELLAASLTDEQWGKLTSEAGLSVSDLQPGDQTQLFTALLANGRLKVGPWRGQMGANDDKQARDITDKLPQSTLRLSRAFTVMINYDRSGFQVNGLPSEGSTIGKLQLVNRAQFGGSQDTVYGARVRDIVPNTPKASQLDYHDPALVVPVSLDGVATVADLTARLSHVTGRELIADARIEKEPVTIVGAITPSASDLLQAMAYCVTGTWRKVGTEYVLTDDVAGIGSRTQMWMEFERTADARRKAVVERASKDITRRHSPDSISWFGSPLAYTDEQMKERERHAPEQRILSPFIDGTFSKLTPAQQALVRQADAWLAKNYEWQYQHENLKPPTADTKVTLYPAVEVQLIAPSETFPIDLNVETSDLQIFYTKVGSPNEKVSEPRPSFGDQLKQHPEYLKDMEKRQPKFVARFRKDPSHPPTLSEILALLSRRGVIVRAKSADAMRKEIRELKELGFNEAWPMVFEKGVAAVQGTSLGVSGGDDILDAAVDEGKKQGLAVFPVIDLLMWGNSAPENARDFNIIGETSAKVWKREHELNDDHINFESGMAALDRPLDPSTIAVNPLVPSVGKSLRDLIARIAAHPGIAGVVLRETSPTGYGPVHAETITSSLTMGYNEPMRALFLRDAHIDPIDIVSPNFYTGKANTELPLFNDRHGVLNNLVPQWLKFRREQNEAFVTGLFDLVRPAGTPPGHGMPLLIKERGRMAGLGDQYTTAYVSWEDREIIPAVHQSGEGETFSSDAVTPPNGDYHMACTPLTPAALKRLTADTWMFYDEYADAPSASFLVDMTGPDIPSDQDDAKMLADDLGMTVTGS